MLTKLIKWIFQVIKTKIISTEIVYYYIFPNRIKLDYWNFGSSILGFSHEVAESIVMIFHMGEASSNYKYCLYNIVIWVPSSSDAHETHVTCIQLLHTYSFYIYRQIYCSTPWTYLLADPNLWDPQIYIGWEIYIIN